MEILLRKSVIISCASSSNKRKSAHFLQLIDQQLGFVEQDQLELRLLAGVAYGNRRFIQFVFQYFSTELQSSNPLAYPLLKTTLLRLKSNSSDILKYFVWDYFRIETRNKDKYQNYLPHLH